MTIIFILFILIQVVCDKFPESDYQIVQMIAYIVCISIGTVGSILKDWIRERFHPEIITERTAIAYSIRSSMFKQIQRLFRICFDQSCHKGIKYSHTGKSQISKMKCNGNDHNFPQFRRCLTYIFYRRKLQVITLKKSDITIT